MVAKGKEVATQDTAGELVISEEVRAMFASMVVAVPDADDGEGQNRILLTLLNATNWDDLDAPWDSQGGKAYDGQEQRIDSIMRRPSRFAGGLGFFLVVTAELSDTKEKIVWTTSSLSITVQLVKAYTMGVLPILAKLVVADTPSARGYFPQHLEILGAAGQPRK